MHETDLFAQGYFLLILIQNHTLIPGHSLISLKALAIMRSYNQLAII